MSPHRFFFRTLLYSLVCSGLLAATLNAQDFNKQVIYQIITDRFFNGDTTNDNPPKIAANGSVTWENGSNHTYTVPTSGTGFVNANWQY